MATPHLEVIPRIIDTSIAATYPNEQSTHERTEVSTNSSHTEDKIINNPQTIIPIVPITFTQRFFNTIKDYAIPIIFIIAVIVIIYIIWKYWTAYRNNNESDNKISESKDKLLDHLDKELPKVKEDLSKYLLNSDSDAFRAELEPIKEESNDDSEEESNDDSDEDFDDESKVSDQEDEGSESVVSEPDFSLISKLVSNTISTDDSWSNYNDIPDLISDDLHNDTYPEISERFEYIENQDDVNNDINSNHAETNEESSNTFDYEPIRNLSQDDIIIEQPSKPKRAKKNKRVIL